MNIDHFSAFIAGLLSFLSPCILPLLPTYLSMLAGQTISTDTNNATIRLRAVSGAVFFGLGFSIVFVILGAVSSGIGQFLLLYKHIIYTVLGVVVILLGLHMLGILKIGALYKEKRLHVNVFKKSKYRLWQAFIIGLAFAFGWTPCVGPILGGILTLAAQKEHLSEGMTLLLSYSLGLWIPFLLTAIFTSPIMAFLSKYPKLAIRSQQVAGVLLILMGVLLMSGQLSRLSALLG